MLITKFNRMIRSRVLWGFFAALISVAFVFTFSRSGGCKPSPSSRGVVARLFGQDITQTDFLAARFHELGMRRNVNLPPESENILRDRVWKRLAALSGARQLGLQTTDEEVADVIQQDRTFLNNGVFDANRYKGTVERQLGVGVGSFESYLREQITLEKMQQLAMAATWSSPLELDERIADLTDVRTAEFVVLDRASFAPAVKATEEDARTFYAANTNLFMAPDRVRVRYVKIPLTNFSSRVTVLDTNVVDYYNEHIDQYSSLDTNNQTVVTPLAEVRGQITSYLTRQALLDAAKDAATTGLVVRLAPGRRAQGIPFEVAATDMGLAIHTTTLFAADEDVPEIEAGADFRKAAFDLVKDDPELCFSDAVLGRDAVYVLAALDRVDAHVPPFEEVRNLAVTRATSNAVEKAYADRIAEVHKALAATGSTTQSFARAAKAFGLTVHTTGQFSVYAGIQSGYATNFSEAVSAAVVTLQAGEVSEARPVPSGMLIASTTTRTANDPGTAALLRPQVVSSLDRYRAGITYRSWVAQLLKDGKFEDISKAPRSQEDEEPMPSLPVDLF